MFVLPMSRTETQFIAYNGPPATKPRCKKAANANVPTSLDQRQDQCQAVNEDEAGRGGLGSARSDYLDIDEIFGKLSPEIIRPQPSPDQDQNIVGEEWLKPADENLPAGSAQGEPFSPKQNCPGLLGLCLPLLTQ
jgi:hypothetical protein